MYQVAHPFHPDQPSYPFCKAITHRYTQTKSLNHPLQYMKEPVLRTRYKRAAFQKSDTNEVRISLDTNVGG